MGKLVDGGRFVRFLTRLFFLLTMVVSAMSALAQTAVPGAKEAFARGYEHSRAGRNEEAVKEYGKAISLDARYLEAYVNRGIALRTLGQVALAIEDFNAALRIAPHPLAYNSRGIARRMLREYQAAIDDYNQAMNMDPQYAWPYNNLAWLMATVADARFRDGNKAVELARKACDLSAWKVSTHLDTLAAAYAEAGDFSLAVQWQEKALALANFTKDQEERARRRLDLYRQGKPFRD